MAAPRYSIPAFLQEIGERFKPEAPETFWACEPSLRSLLDGHILEEWYNDELRRLAADDHYLGDWLPNEVVLHRGRGWLLSVALLDAPRRYIHVLPFYAMYVALDSGGLTYDLYRLPPAHRNDVFDPAIRLEPAGSQTAASRQIVRLQSDQCAYDFKIPRPLAVVRFVTQPLRPLEWLFSKSTLQAWQANDADLSFTQLRVAAHVLGKIAHQSSIGPLRQLTAHPHHSVRWAAIQNLGRLNRSEALVKIREAVNDPHPHVRRAALKTLEQLEKKRQ